MDKSRRLIDVQVYTQEKLWRIYGANIYSTFSQEISSPSTPSLSFLYQLHVFLRHWLAICRRMYQKHLYHLPQPPKTKPKPKQNKTQQQPSMTEGGGNGNTLWHSCLEDPIDRGAWRAAILGVAKSWTWLSDGASLKCDSRQRPQHSITDDRWVTRAYLESDGPLMTGDINAVGLAIGHAPVVHVNVIGLPGATQVVPDLEASCIEKRKETQSFLCSGFHINVTPPALGSCFH